MRNDAQFQENSVLTTRCICRLLFVGIVIIGLAAIPVSAAKLATPTIVTPPNNYHSYYYPPSLSGNILISWKPVNGATNYNLEYYYKSGNNWVFAGTATTAAQATVQSLNIQYSWKFRIVATNGNPGEDSNPSAWRYFDFKDPRVKLATPVLVGPPMATDFYHTPRGLVLEWKPVVGANQYKLDAQYYEPASAKWISIPSGTPFPYPITIDGTLSTTYDSLFNGPYKGRWCVQALDSTGVWQPSTPSAWRTFTFKN